MLYVRPAVLVDGGDVNRIALGDELVLTFAKLVIRAGHSGETLKARPGTVLLLGGPDAFGEHDFSELVCYQFVAAFEVSQRACSRSLRFVAVNRFGIETVASGS